MNRPCQTIIYSQFAATEDAGLVDTEAVAHNRFVHNPIDRTETLQAPSESVPEQRKVIGDRYSE